MPEASRLHTIYQRLIAPHRREPREIQLVRDAAPMGEPRNENADSSHFPGVVDRQFSVRSTCSDGSCDCGVVWSDKNGTTTLGGVYTRLNVTHSVVHDDLFLASGNPVDRNVSSTSNRFRPDQVADIAVLKEHQGKGIGKMIMSEIVKYLEASVPESGYVSLIADGQAQNLYAQFGFVHTAPSSVGMVFKHRTAMAQSPSA